MVQLLEAGRKRTCILRIPEREKALGIYDDMKQIAANVIIIRGIMIKKAKLVENDEGMDRVKRKY